jgi:hypothetical protein
VQRLALETQLVEAEKLAEEEGRKLANATAFLNLEGLADEKKNNLTGLLKAINTMDLSLEHFSKQQKVNTHTHIHTHTQEMSDGVMGVGAATLSKAETLKMISRFQENHYDIIGQCVELLDGCNLGGNYDINYVKDQAKARLNLMRPTYFDPPGWSENKRKRANGCQCRAMKGPRCIKGRCPCTDSNTECTSACRCGCVAGNCMNYRFGDVQDLSD